MIQAAHKQSSALHVVEIRYLLFRAPQWEGDPLFATINHPQKQIGQSFLLRLLGY